MSTAPSTAPAARGALIHPILAGVVGSVTGFSSSFALVIAGARAVGADPAQAASGLLVLCVVQGSIAIALSLATRSPISIAWSTPGSAVLVTAGAMTHDFGVAIAAFIVAGILLAVTGLWPWLARKMTRIPPPIASAMLAGILFPICISPVTAAVQLPLLALPPIVVWLVLSRFAPRWAVPGALVATIVVVGITAARRRADAGRPPSSRRGAAVIVVIVAVAIAALTSAALTATEAGEQARTGTGFFSGHDH